MLSSIKVVVLARYGAKPLYEKAKIGPPKASQDMQAICIRFFKEVALIITVESSNWNLQQLQVESLSPSRS